MGTRAHWFSSRYRYRVAGEAGWRHADTLADIKADTTVDERGEVQRHGPRRDDGYGPYGVIVGGTVTAASTKPCPDCDGTLFAHLTGRSWAHLYHHDAKACETITRAAATAGPAPGTEGTVTVLIANTYDAGHTCTREVTVPAPSRAEAADAGSPFWQEGVFVETGCTCGPAVLPADERAGSSHTASIVAAADPDLLGRHAGWDD